MTAIHPELQLTPTTESVLSILAHYGISECSWELATSGIQNLTIIINSSNGKYVLRVYRKGRRDLQSIKEEVDFVQYLKDERFPVVSFRENIDGDRVTVITLQDQPWICVLMDFAVGEHVSQYSRKLIMELADLQVRLHLKGEKYCNHRLYSGEIKNLPSYYSPLPAPGKYGEEVEKFLQRAKQYTVQAPSLPAGMIHGDFDTGNILVSDGTISAVLDFDGMAFAPLAVCLGNTLWHVLVTTNDESMVHLYLAQYAKGRRLSREELEILPKVMLLRQYVIGLLSATIWNSSEKDILTLLPEEDHLLKLQFQPSQKLHPSKIS